MNEFIKPFLVPAVLVAAITLMVQGILGIINTILQMRAGKAGRDANQINYVVSLLQLIDGLPISPGQKATKKVYVTRTLLPVGLPKELEDLIKEELGSSKSI